MNSEYWSKVVFIPLYLYLYTYIYIYVYLCIYLYYIYYTYEYTYIYIYIMFIYTYLYIEEHNVWSVTNKPYQCSSRCVLSFKDSSALLHNWELNFITVKSFLSQAHCLWWKPEIYIGIPSKWTKQWKQNLAIKQVLEILFLTIKMCTNFTTDVICRCVLSFKVSLALLNNWEVNLTKVKSF